MNCSGSRKPFVCILLAGMLSTAFLNGCSFTSQPTDTDSQLAEGYSLEAEESAPTKGEVLRDQLISVLNLDRALDNRIISSTSVDDAASLLIQIILEDPEVYLETEEGRLYLQSMLGSTSFAYLYDGSGSSAQAASKALKDLKALEKELNTKLKEIYSLSVTYGQSGKTSIWLVIATSSDTDTDPAANADPAAAS